MFLVTHALFSVCIGVCIYIYMYRERERERGREGEIERETERWDCLKRKVPLNTLVNQHLFLV